MGTRNTPVLREIIAVLTPQLYLAEYALHQLEDHFQSRLLVDVGNIATVASAATQLRLAITAEERAVVLDHIAEQQMVLLTADQVETAINALFEDRFVEP